MNLLMLNMMNNVMNNLNQAANNIQQNQQNIIKKSKEEEEKQTQENEEWNLLFHRSKKNKNQEFKIRIYCNQMRLLWMLLKDIYIKLEKKGRMLFLFLMEEKLAQKICQKKLVKCI